MHYDRKTVDFKLKFNYLTIIDGLLLSDRPTGLFNDSDVRQPSPARDTRS